ncbi:nitronate monooxygenase [Devosia oryzisoli]
MVPIQTFFRKHGLAFSLYEDYHPKRLEGRRESSNLLPAKGGNMRTELQIRSEAVCDLLGCRIPLVLAGMGGVARSELVAAVTAAGGFGFLGMVREPVDLIEREVRRVRDAGHMAFGVNLIPAATEPTLLARQLDALIDLEVPVVELFWDIDTHVVDRLRNAGVVVVYQVGSAGEARAAERAGAQAIVAQGVEAGGHVRGVTPLRELLPAVVSAVSVPVLAAGGLSSGADMAIAMAMGAKGVVLGTALMATEEAFAHPYHQQRLVEAAAEDTVLTGSFHINWPPNAPVRVLRSPLTATTASSAELQQIGEEEGRPIYRFSTDSPLKSMTGDFASMALYAGTGVGAIGSVVSAAERIAQILEQADRLMPDFPTLPITTSSSVCMAGEFTGAYMGHAEAEEISDCLRDIAHELTAILRASLARRADEGTLAKPPFDRDAATLAGWVLVMDQLCAESDVAIGNIATSSQTKENSDQELSRRRTLVRDRLANLLPRMPENRTRAVLSALGRFVASMPFPNSDPSGGSGSAVL